MRTFVRKYKRPVTGPSFLSYTVIVSMYCLNALMFSCTPARTIGLSIGTMSLNLRSLMSKNSRNFGFTELSSISSKRLIIEPLNSMSISHGHIAAIRSTAFCALIVSIVRPPFVIGNKYGIVLYYTGSNLCEKNIREVSGLRTRVSCCQACYHYTIAIASIPTSLL